MSASATPTKDATKDDAAPLGASSTGAADAATGRAIARRDSSGDRGRTSIADIVVA